MDYSPERHRQFHSSAEQVPRESIESNKVQMTLMLMLDPADRRHAAELWLAEDASGDSYAGRYRELVESPEYRGKTVDLTDEASLTLLFKTITNPTIH